MSVRRPIGSAIIVGGGAPALLCAMALKRTLPQCAITVMRDPAAPAGLADRMHWAGPALLRLHERLGIDEGDMLARIGASHRVGCDMHGWGTATLLCEGAALDAPLHGWSDLPTVSQALAAAERFGDGGEHPSGALSDLDFGMRFNPPAYLQMLAFLAGKLGIVMMNAAVGSVEMQADGRIAALALADGRRLAADLYVDTMAGAPLAGALGIGRLDWTDQFFSDRLLLSRGLPPALSLRDELRAGPHGWTLRSPGRDATTIIHGCRAGEESAGIGDFETIPVAAGRPETFAIKNLVSIGDAATMIEPLGDSPLSLAAAQIALMIDLLPGGDCHPLEVAELDRRLARQADRARDHAACFLAGTKPSDGAYWAAARTVTQSDSLRTTLDGYRRRGRFTFFEDDPHDKAAWLQLLGLVAPDAPPPPPIAALSKLAVDNARCAHEAKLARAMALAEPYPNWLQKRIPR